MINQCIVTGNLGDDPKVFYSPDGNPVSSFNIAFQSGKKKTCWIKCMTLHKLADIFIVREFVHCKESRQ